MLVKDFIEKFLENTLRQTRGCSEHDGHSFNVLHSRAMSK